MGFGYGLGYVESETVASGAAVSGRVNTVEAVEKHMSYDHFHDQMLARGVIDQTLDTIRKCGIDLSHWLEGFKDTHESVRRTVETIRTHPLVPTDIIVRGFIIDSETGLLEEVTEQ